MWNESRLSHATNRFLRGVRDGTLLIKDLSDYFRVKPHLFARWCGRRAFRAALRETLRTSRDRRRLELDVLATTAQCVLKDLAEGRVPREPGTALTCEVILRVQREEEQARLRAERAARKRREARAKERGPKLDVLTHPLMTPAEVKATLLMLDRPPSSSSSSTSAHAPGS